MVEKLVPFTGVIVPMVSPFDEHLNIDRQAVERMLKGFIDNNISPFLLGTTGESVSLSRKQKLDLVDSVTEICHGKVKVYAGISGNCLAESVEEAKVYADYGIDAVVAHLPFYYPLDDNQMLHYYEQLADHVPCPLILYNNPITTKFSVSLNLIEKLSYHPNIAGVKDSERGQERLDQAIAMWSRRSDFVHLIGWAAQSAYALLKGSDGIIPSTGNVTPVLYKELYEAALSGNALKANGLQEKANLISEIYQKNRNLSKSLPALKVMMSAVGLCQPYVLPPMYRLDGEEEQLIGEQTRAILKEFHAVQ